MVLSRQPKPEVIVFLFFPFSFLFLSFFFLFLSFSFSLFSQFLFVKVLVNEVMLMKKCKDKSIVSFKDSFLVGGVLWVVMELIDGEDLTNVLQVKMGEPQMALIVREVIRALAHMHAMGVIHRDIKSDNVMVSVETGAVKLTDFGFGAQVTQARGQRNTMVFNFFVNFFLLLQRKGVFKSSERF